MGQNTSLASRLPFPQLELLDAGLDGLEAEGLAIRWNVFCAKCDERTRVVGASPYGKSALMLAAARLRQVAATSH
jgi:hypothetical protein